MKSRERCGKGRERRGNSNHPRGGRDPVPFTGTKSAKQLNELTKNMAGKERVERKLHYGYFLILC